MSARDNDPALVAAPRDLHDTFSWYNPGTTIDSHAMLVSRTHNVMRGVTLILQLIHSNKIDIETDSDRLLGTQEIEDLTLFATESARMLGEQTGSEIVRINNSQKGGAA